MKTCPNCNAINNDTSAFCEVCGSPLSQSQAPQQAASQYGTPQYGAQQYRAPIYPQFNENKFVPEYEPISVGAYLGYMVLFSIPVIGIIMMLVTAFGSGEKSLKNFAKAHLILYVIAVVISIVLILLGAGATGYYY